eukprot:CCRYP_019505-RA/>CCRYP_019505-RA protein AED:0.18 eAED:0.18 QI:171/1/1/1/0/0/2/89/71
MEVIFSGLGPLRPARSLALYSIYLNELTRLIFQSFPPLPSPATSLAQRKSLKYEIGNSLLVAILCSLWEQL